MDYNLGNQLDIIRRLNVPSPSNKLRAEVKRRVEAIANWQAIAIVPFWHVRCFFCFILSLESRLDEKTMGLLWKASFLHRNGHRTMVVAPKYKHYDGISYCGETRVRIKDQEDRSADQQIEVDLSSLLTVNVQQPLRSRCHGWKQTETSCQENVKYWHLRKDCGEALHVQPISNKFERGCCLRLLFLVDNSK